MNMFNRKSLCVAIAATGLLGAGGVAQAVNLSEDGTGNVLVYPYYTVRTTAAGNAYNTYINFTNTTASTKAVKVRFREGRRSREVLDFNVFLSPFDMWTAVVTPTSAGAQVQTFDRSCTIPSFYAVSDTQNAGASSPVAFRSGAYTVPVDGAGVTLDRTREGYIEVFEMATYAVTSLVHAGSLHSRSTGAPANCAGFTDTVAANEALPVSGGLMGMGQLINPGAGASMSYNPVVLDNFYLAGTSHYFDTGSQQPSMNDADIVSAVKSGTTLKVSSWPAPAKRPVDAVSAVLMHNNVLNEYILDTGTLSKTDWVVTFPTKGDYVAVGSGAALPPFQRNFNPAIGLSCDDVNITFWDREERVRGEVPGSPPDFSPRNTPDSPLTPSLCYEANVVTFNAVGVSGTTVTGLLGSLNSTLDISTNLNATGTPSLAQNGWARLGFGGALTSPSTNTVSLITGLPVGTQGVANTYNGLPVTGFNVFSYTNTALKVGSVVSNVPTNYGMGVNHKYTTSIQ